MEGICYITQDQLSSYMELVWI